MSYFPCDIPFMSDEELKENGINIPKDVSDTNVGNIEYIRREDAIRLAEQGQVQGFPWQFQMLTELPPVDVVSVSAYKQVMWERDIAVEQLKQIGKGLGEVMDDVALVAHGWRQK